MNGSKCEKALYLKVYGRTPYLPGQGFCLSTLSCWTQPDVDVETLASLSTFFELTFASYRDDKEATYLIWVNENEQRLFMVKSTQPSPGVVRMSTRSVTVLWANYLWCRHTSSSVVFVVACLLPLSAYQWSLITNFPWIVRHFIRTLTDRLFSCPLFSLPYHPVFMSWDGSTPKKIKRVSGGFFLRVCPLGSNLGRKGGVRTPTPALLQHLWRKL